MDEALTAQSLKASSVKDSPSSFFRHHVLPSAPSLVFLSPSLLSFTVRKDYLWRDNSVPRRTGKDGEPQTLLQWVTLTAGGHHQAKIWAPVGFHAAVLFLSCPRLCQVSVWISEPRTWAYLPTISSISLVCATRHSPPTPGAVLFAFCLSHVCDMCAWTTCAENEAVAFVMTVDDGFWWRHQPLLVAAFSRRVICHLCGSKKEDFGMEVHARYSVWLCSFS